MTDPSGSWSPPPQPPSQPTGPGPMPSPGYPQAPPPGYPPAPPAGYSTPMPMPASGALGKPRGIGISILLAIVTLGIYTYVWTWKTHDEIKKHSGVGVGGPLGFVIYFVVSPVTFFLLPNEVKQMLEQSGRTSKVSAITGLWFILPLIGTIVWFVKVQGQLNEYWRSLGATG